MKKLVSTLFVTACFLAPLVANEEQKEEGKDLPVQEKLLLCCIDDENTTNEPSPEQPQLQACSCCEGDRDSFVFRVIYPGPDLEPGKDVVIM